MQLEMANEACSHHSGAMNKCSSFISFGNQLSGGILISEVLFGGGTINKGISSPSKLIFPIWSFGT